MHTRFHEFIRKYTARCDVESNAIMSNMTLHSGKKVNIIARLWRDRFTYLLLIPAFVFTLLFAYWPIYGLILAFKDYSFRGGIFGSPWTANGGFYWFLKMFNDPEFLHVLWNTISISFWKIVISTVTCIIFALLLNEVRGVLYKRLIQSVMYLPYFLSWVIMASIIYNLFTSSGGVMSRLLQQLNGGEKIQIIGNSQYFRAELYISMVWKSVGFGSIIYLAAIAGVSQELYEAAIIDGANRFQRVWYITIPSIKSVIVLLLILDVGGIMSAGFDQIFNLYSPMVFNVGDVLDTYIYRHGVTSGQFSYTTAVGLFKNIVSFGLLLLVNFVAKRLGEEGVL
jgi:putative aldouronate transport system permease protein